METNIAPNIDIHLQNDSSTTPAPSNSEETNKTRSNNLQTFESLLAAVTNEIGGGCIGNKDGVPQDLSARGSRDVTMMETTNHATNDIKSEQLLSSFVSPNLLAAIGLEHEVAPPTTSRPQIIVSPRKTATAMEVVYQEQQNVDSLPGPSSEEFSSQSGSNTRSGASTPSTSSSRSPSKSVIVRVGSAMVSFLKNCL